MPLREELTKLLHKMQGGDRAYYYYPDNLTVFRHPGEVIGHIMNQRASTCDNLAEGLSQTVAMLTMEDIDAEKFVIVILDRDDVLTDYNLKKCLKLARRAKMECKFILITLGDDCSRSLDAKYGDAGYDHTHFVDTEGVGAKLCELCIDEPVPLNYSPLDVNELARGYKEHYGEQTDTGEADQPTTGWLEPASITSGQSPTAERTSQEAAEGESRQDFSIKADEG